jgi:hypothetical protein
MPTQEIVGHATARRDTGLIRPLEVDDCLTSPALFGAADLGRRQSRSHGRRAVGGGVRMNEPVPADTVPGHQSLTLPVLKAAVGEQRIGAVAPSLGAKLGMSEAARAALPASGRQTIFANRVHWAKTYLAKAGPAEATRRCHFCLPSPMFGSFVVDQKRRPETTPGSDCSR